MSCGLDRVLFSSQSQRGLCLQAHRRGTLQWHEADPQRKHQQAPSTAVPEKLSATAARDWLRKSLEPYTCRIAGISFEGRQSLIPQLQEGRPVEFRHEPDNPYDSNAVKVLTLDGLDLGYVPRAETATFGFNTTFGHVISVGPAADSGLSGVLVRAWPTLPPLTVDAFPSELAPVVNLSTLLSGADWEQLAHKTYATADHRCEVTGGVGPAWPVECQEVWEFDDKQHVLRLMGMTALAPEVHLAKHIMQLDGQQQSRALETLEQVNMWNLGDVETYLKGVAEQAQHRSNHIWQLDLTWLHSQGVKVPALPPSYGSTGPAVSRQR
ncbi:hypothetical protein WJX74_000596 [Apatococcus lobatus]|uniref:HIRAN domain-containing protein n=1 Tax=Apatococcus lobatus TaxID=904363 RepID=A0AAW1Q4A4_9CHLO